MNASFEPYDSIRLHYRLRCFDGLLLNRLIARPELADQPLAGASLARGQKRGHYGSRVMSSTSRISSPTRASSQPSRAPILRASGSSSAADQRRSWPQ